MYELDFRCNTNSKGHVCTPAVFDSRTVGRTEDLEVVAPNCDLVWRPLWVGAHTPTRCCAPLIAHI
jgi:hypothetical protein